MRKTSFLEEGKKKNDVGPMMSAPHDLCGRTAAQNQSLKSKASRRTGFCDGASMAGNERRGGGEHEQKAGKRKSG